MSEYLQSQEYKQQILKGLITDLHQGRDFDEVKREFNELIAGVDAVEIASMEQKLIEEGMPPEEIKRLCDVHAAIFRETLAKNEQPEMLAGHPLYNLKHENNEARKVLSEIETHIEKFSHGQRNQIKDLQERFEFFRNNLDKHYSKKENIIFPYLERHNITGPPSVMWSVDDEIRGMLKAYSSFLEHAVNSKQSAAEIESRFFELKNKVNEMFSKEEDILAPMLKDSLTDQEWAEIKEQESEFGVIFSKPQQPELWQPQELYHLSDEVVTDTGALQLDTGVLTQKQINSILTNLPIDITFVDENDEVRYFSQGKERIFTRTKSIIGRKVQNCHPPESVHVVEKIVNDFKTGKHSNAEFWLELSGKFVYIQYIAIRDDDGRYKGTMEVTQDITRPRSLEGERRLLKYDEQIH